MKERGLGLFIIPWPQGWQLYVPLFNFSNHLKRLHKLLVWLTLLITTFFSIGSRSNQCPSPFRKAYFHSNYLLSEILSSFLGSNDVKWNVWKWICSVWYRRVFVTRVTWHIHHLVTSQATQTWRLLWLRISLDFIVAILECSPAKIFSTLIYMSWFYPDRTGICVFKTFAFSHRISLNNGPMNTITFSWFS